MAKKLSELLEMFELLCGTAVSLNKKLSAIAKALKNEDELLPRELSKDITSLYEQFDYLRDEVIKFSKTLEISSKTPKPEQINSLRELKDLFEVLLAEEQRKENKSKDILNSALEVLKEILLIEHVDDIEYPPLQKCQEVALRLQHSLQSEKPVITSVVRALATDKHPLSALLSLIKDRKSSDDEYLANLQRSIMNEFDLSLATAAITGKLLIHTEILLTFSETNIDELRTSRNEKNNRIEKKFSNNQSVRDSSNSEKSNLQELALSIKQQATDQRLAPLQYLVTQLICENQAGLAFHLAHCLDVQYPSLGLPTKLIWFAILGQNIREDVGVGEIANVLNEGFHEFSYDYFVEGDDAWNRSISLILVSSVLRPALLAPNTGAAHALQLLQLGEGFSHLYEYCKIIEQYARHLQPLKLNALREVKSKVAQESELLLLGQKAKQWLSSEALGKTTTYQQAIKVWRKWLEPGELVHSLVTPIIENDTTKLQSVKEIVNRLLDETTVEREVAHTGRQVLKRRSGDPLHAAAIRKIRMNLREAIELVKSWISLHDFDNQYNSSYFQETAKELKQKLKDLHSDVLNELTHFEEASLHSLDLPGQTRGWTLAGIALCRRTVNSIQSMFEQDIPTIDFEPKIPHLLHAELLKISSLSLDENWEPEETPEKIIEGIVELLSQDVCSWNKAFEEQVSKRDHEATDRIIEYLRVYLDLKPTSEKFKEVRQNQLSKCWQEMQRLANETQEEVEEAVALGLLPEVERTDYNAKIQEIKNDIKRTYRFYPKLKKLCDMKTNLSDKREEKVSETRRELINLELNTDSSEYLLVNKHLEQGDFLVASEYIQMISKGEVIENRHVKNRKGSFHDFFLGENNEPSKLSSITKMLTRYGQRREREREAPSILTQIRKRQGFCGIDLRVLSGAEAGRAAEMMQAWLRSKENKGVIDESNLKKILESLGFNKIVLKGSQIKGPYSGHEIWLSINTSTVRDRNSCSIPAYGSETKGRYRVLCVWDRPNEEALLNIISNTSQGAPIIVFFFGRLTETRRLNFAHLCWERRQAFIIIDDILMFYLCGASGSRLPVLFNCTLPFTFLTPYTSVAGLVPPEMFYGRKIERESIMDPKGSCFIYGGRQLGKTALLKDVERTFHNPNNGHIALLLDLVAEGIGSDRDIDEFWSLLANRLKALNLGIVPSRLSSNILPSKLFEHIKSWLDFDPERRILLLLDEADRFFEYDGRGNGEQNSRTGEFCRCGRLKGWMDRTERRFKVVFAGLHNVQRTTRLSNHPLAHYGEPICIGPLLDNKEWQEARNLIKIPLTSIGYEISDDVITRILSQTNYYPSLIQLYCKELLQHVNGYRLKASDLGDRSLPYTITLQHVEEVYQNPDLRNSIKNRFKWTLQLDQRYEMIAYTIALGSIEKRQNAGAQSSEHEGFSVNWVQEQVQSLWEEGFHGKSEDEIRALLEEMVGLGILRETKGSGFALRSPNVALLMGTENDIISQLTNPREAPLEYEPASFRAALRSESKSDPDISRRSPLTAQQESVLRRREHGVSIIFGCHASGLHDVERFLKSPVNGESFDLLQDVADERAFSKNLADLNYRKWEGTKILLLPAACSWTMSWVEKALDKVSHLSSKRSFVRIVFVANPELTFQLLSEGTAHLDTLTSKGLTKISLKPWQDEALRRWLEESNYPIDQSGRKEISKVTGNWPERLYDFYEACKPPNQHAWKSALQKCSSSLNNSETIEEIFQSFGLAGKFDSLRPILYDLSILGEASAEELVTLMEDTPIDMVNLVLEWAELLSFAGISGKTKDNRARWYVNSFVSRILQFYA